MWEPIRVKEYISETGMDFLPSGMLIKSDTGMGATHLELICARHSIVVDRIKQEYKTSQIIALVIGFALTMLTLCIFKS